MLFAYNDSWQELLERGRGIETGIKFSVEKDFWEITGLAPSMENFEKNGGHNV